MKDTSVPPREVRGAVDRALEAERNATLHANADAQTAVITAWRVVADDPATQRNAAFREAVATNLATALLNHFRTTRERSDIDAAVDTLRSALSMSVPDSAHRASLQNNLALVLWERFKTLGNVEDLRPAIAASRAAVAGTPRGGPDWFARQASLAAMLLRQLKHEVSGNPERPDVVDVCREVLDELPGGSALRPTWQELLAGALETRFEVRGDTADLADAVAVLDEARAAATPGSSEWIDRQVAVAQLLSARFQAGGLLADIDRAIEICRQTLDRTTPGSSRWAMVQGALGSHLRMRADATNSEDDLRGALDALRSAREHAAEGTQVWLRRTINLGLALRTAFDFWNNLDDLNAAINCYRSASAAAEPDSLDWATCQANAANALRARSELLDSDDDLDAAIEHLEAALLLVAPESPLAVRWRASLGNALRIRFERRGQRPDLDAAIEALRHAVTTLHPDTRTWADWNGNLGAALSLAGQFDEAIRVLVSSVSATPRDTFDWARWQTNLGQALRDRFERTQSDSDAVQAIEAFREALSVAGGHELWQGVALTATRGWADIEFARGHWPEAADILVRAVDASNRLYRRQSAPTSGQVWLARAADTYRRAGYALARVGRLREAAAVFEQGRARALGDLMTGLSSDNLARAHEIDVSDVVEAVRPGQPLVYLATTPAGSLALVVELAPGATEHAVAAIWAHDFRTVDLVAMLVGADADAGGYLRGQLVRSDWLEAALPGLLDTLGERIVGPLADHLRTSGATGVVLVPAGSLGLVPLHAARFPVAGMVRSLIDEFDVTYCPSARVMTGARAALSRRAPNAGGFVGVADPLGSTPPLPFAVLELNAVAAFFPGPVTLLADTATRQALVAGLPRARFVHLACHAYFDVDAPRESRLELAHQPGQDPTESHLRLQQISASKLLATAQLVVLSACRTAVAEFSRLPDEAIGLPAACLQAGAATVIGSLWAVNDVSTALLMERFYTLYMRGDPATVESRLSPPRALRRAQTWLRDVTGGELLPTIERWLAGALESQQPLSSQSVVALRAFANRARRNPQWQPFTNRPYTWAAFVCVGA